MTTNYKDLGYELGALLEEKQRAYGNVFSVTPAIIGLLFPDGIPVLAYRDLLTLVRILDKVGRITTAAGRGDPMGEDPWRDIAGYAMLALGQREEQQRKEDLETERYLAAEGPEPEPSNDWALTWQDGHVGPFIESLFPTRERAMAKHAEKAAKQSRLTWRVCRVDEVGK